MSSENCSTETADTGNSTYGQFFVAGVGDVNNDGNRDVYVGDYNANGGNGRAYVYSGTDGALIHKFIGTAGAGLGPGRGAGDVNGDGYADLIVGEYTNSAGGAFAGRTRVYSGRTGAVLRIITSTTAAENLGFDAVGVGDVNGDGLIDLMISAATGNRVYVIEGTEFTCPTRDAPAAEPAGLPYNRYLAIDAGNPGSSSAIRVTLTTVGGFPGFNGQVRWVGPPTLATDGAGSMIQVAQLQCTPHYTHWSTVGIVYAHGAEVVPSSAYDLQVIDEDCLTTLEDSYSDVLPLATQKWGDLVSPFGGDGQPNFGDINALVGAFQQNPGAIRRPQAQLQPNVVNTSTSISFADINADVGAFQNKPYPYTGPVACP